MLVRSTYGCYVFVVRFDGELQESTKDLHMILDDLDKTYYKAQEKCFGE